MEYQVLIEKLCKLKKDYQKKLVFNFKFFITIFVFVAIKKLIIEPKTIDIRDIGIPK